jgi:hypothetical protein
LPALAGDLLYYEDASTRFGRAQIVVLREEESGHPVAVWLTHGVLRREFEKHDPRPGDKLTITYDGRRTSKAKRTYFAYTVEVNDRAPQPTGASRFRAKVGPVDCRGRPLRKG